MWWKEKTGRGERESVGVAVVRRVENVRAEVCSESIRFSHFQHSHV